MPSLFDSAALYTAADRSAVEFWITGGSSAYDPERDDLEMAGLVYRSRDFGATWALEVEGRAAFYTRITFNPEGKTAYVRGFNQEEGSKDTVLMFNRD